MIVFENISKTYADGTKAIDGLSGTFEESKLGVVLGDNGAGKTTLLKILASLLNPTKGTVKNSIPDSIGYMGQDAGASFYELLTVYENLQFFTKLNNYNLNKKEIQDLLKYYDLSKLLETKFYKLSGGQKQIVSFIRAFLHKPKIVILDEPFANISPDKISLMSGFIYDYIREHKSLVILSSHSLENITLYFDFTYYINNMKGYFLTQTFVKSLIDSCQIIELFVDEEHKEEFVKSLDTTNILYHRFKGKYALTLISKPNYSLEENDKVKIINTKKPSLTELSLLLKVPEFTNKLKDVVTK